MVYQSPASKSGNISCGDCGCCQSTYRQYACNQKRPLGQLCTTSECGMPINYVECNNKWDEQIVEVRNYYNNFLNQTR